MSDGFFSSLRKGSEAVMNLALSSVFIPVTKNTSMFIDNVEDQAVAVQEKLMSNTFWWASIGLSGVFFILAILFFIVNFLQWPWSAAFLTVGVITLFAGYIMKQMR